MFNLCKFSLTWLFNGCVNIVILTLRFCFAAGLPLCKDAALTTERKAGILLWIMVHAHFCWIFIVLLYIFYWINIQFEFHVDYYIQPKDCIKLEDAANLYADYLYDVLSHRKGLFSWFTCDCSLLSLPSLEFGVWFWASVSQTEQKIFGS